MHSQTLTLLALAALAPAIQASGTFQAFNGYHCDGPNAGAVKTIGTTGYCIGMSGRHTFRLGGTLPNGAAVKFYPTNNCGGGVHHTATYYTGSCNLVNPGFSTHSAWVYQL